MIVFDEGSYPTEEALRTIREWPPERTYGRLLDAIGQCWRWPAYFRKSPRRRHVNGVSRRRWRVSTGGWSGHEDVIGALMDNRLFWAICWVSSERGGHYVFETREEEAP